MIRAEKLCYHVRSKEILSDLSFEVRQGSFTVLVGENGAGKTSLIKLMMGFVKPTSGKIKIWGKAPSDDPFEDRLRMAFLSEKMSPPVDWTIEEYLRFYRFFYPNYSREREATLLALFGLKRELRIGQLSTGESRRAQIVHALSRAPELILVDEITAVLDIVGRARFMRVLQELQANRPCTIVMATNIIDDVDTYATDVILLNKGRLAACESKETMKGRFAKPLAETLAALIEEAA
jgi:ABC-2 type transport system ATP-binding protein